VSISATDVKALRDRTGAGMMECKGALEEANGDLDRAIEILRVRGRAKAAKHGERKAADGVIGHYVHANDRIGVIVEINCETDFVARNDEFKQFARDVALHIAAAAPRWVSEDDVPADVKEAEFQIFAQQAEDKPEHVRSKIAEGKLRKWLEEVVLLDQLHVNADKYEGRSIEQIRSDVSAKTGENVVIRRFARFAIGE
jgi:elongation factor Ts